MQNIPTVLAGQVQNVSWTSTGSDILSFNVYYTTDGTTWAGPWKNFNSPFPATALNPGSSKWQFRIEAMSATGGNGSTLATGYSNVFTVTPVAVTAPTVVSVLVVGTSANVTWSSNAGTGTVYKFSYTTDGSTYSTPVVVTSPYAWTVPSGSTTTAKVKIDVYNAGSVLLTSGTSSPFTITTVSVMQNIPTMLGGQIEPVTWTSVGTGVNSFNLWYTTNGTTWIGPWVATSGFTATMFNTGSSLWQFKIQAMSGANGTGSVLDTGYSNVFTVIPVTVSVMQNVPTLLGGQVQAVTWSSNGGTGTYFQLLYTTDGTNWSTPVTASSGYTWTVPNVGSSLAQIRIDAFNAGNVPLVTSYSNTFTATPVTVSITAPVSGAYLSGGQSSNITWSSNAGTGTVYKFSYTTDGTNWSTPVTASSGYSWTVPSVGVTVARVKIDVYNAGSVLLTSGTSSPFTITTVSVTTPPSLIGYQSYNIAWTSSGTIARFKVTYTTDGSAWNVLTSTAAASPFPWTVPNVGTSSARVAVAALDGTGTPLASATSTAFTITPVAVTVTAPVSGGTPVVGASQSVTWTYTGAGAGSVLDHFKIILSTDGGANYYAYNTVATTTALTGSPETYSWTVPNLLTGPNQAKVRVVAMDSSNVELTTAPGDASAGFTINSDAVSVTAPASGNSWNGGTAQTIMWTTTGGADHYRLDLSTDGGSTYPTLLSASTVGSASSYAWTVNNVSAAGTAKIRVVAYSSTNAVLATGVSAAFSTVQSTATVTAPNGGETINGGSTYSVTWSKTGGAPYYRVSYAADGTNYSVLTSNSTASPYSWTVPNTGTTTGRIKVEALAADGSTVISTDTSDAAFTVLATSVTVTAPNGGNILASGTSYNITWTVTGGADHYRVSYSSTGIGGTYTAQTSTATGLSYTWTVPTTATANGSIKVEAMTVGSPGTPITSDVSDAVFTIATTTVTVTAPNGSESLNGGTTFNITWSHAGTVTPDHYQILLSTNGGTTYPTTIYTSGAGTGSLASYSWYANNVATTQARIQVEAMDSGNNVLAADTSDANFAITQTSVTVATPNGGETLIAGASSNVTWNVVGGSSYYLFSYSTDNGSHWSAAVVATSPYNWTVPDVSTSQGLVKILAMDAGDSMVASDVSNANFTIVQTAVTLTAPNGGNSLLGFGSYSVTWTHAGTVTPDHYRLKLSTDGGSTYGTTIVESATGSPYAWTVNNVTTATAKVKVEALDSGNNVLASDVSDTNFTIAQTTVTVTAPNATGISLSGWQSYNVTWNQAGAADHYRVSLSTDGGSTYPTTLTSSASDSPYAWTVNNVTTATAKIKVEAMDSGNNVLISDASDNNFAITAVTVAVTAPNGGTTLVAGQPTSVTWNHTGTINHYRLKLSTDGGSTYGTTLSASATSPYSWTVPDVSSATARIQVEALDASNNVLAADSSDTDFAIAQTSVTVTAPNGGETLTGGAPYAVTWTHAGPVDHYRFSYTTDGTNWSTPVGPVTTPYSWTAPNTNVTTVKVKIEALDGGNNVIATDFSDADFAIAQTAVTVTAPNGGQNFSGYSTQGVAWTHVGNVDHYRISLSTDGGSNYAVLTSSAATSPWSWTLPNTGTTAARIRVEALDVTNKVIVSDASDADFAITAVAATVAAPNGGQSLSGGAPYSVTWTNTGTVDHYRLKLSTDGGATYPTTLSASATSPFAWTVNQVTTAHARLQVEALDSSGDVLASDASDADFAITATAVTVAAPNGGETLSGGSTYSVAWTPAGNVDHYRFSYTTDGTAWSTPVSPVTTPYAWTVPNAGTATAKVKIESLDASNNVLVSDLSDASFTIIQTTVTVATPNGGQSLNGGSTFNVTWTTTGGADHYRLSYSTDGGSTWSAPVSPVATPYAWTVPNAGTATAKVKIEAMDSGNNVIASDSSDANFTIVQTTVTLTAPNGGQTLSGRQAYAVTWTHAGGADHYRIALSTDGGSTYGTALSASATSPYAWTVSSVLTSQARIRVEALDAGNGVIASDASDADFAIISPTVTLRAPVGGENLLAGGLYDVTWSATGTVDHYRLKLSTDSGATFPTTVVDPLGPSPLHWTVSGTQTARARMLIEAVDAQGDVVASDESAADFAIDAHETPTVSNNTPLSRLQAGAVSTFSMSFVIHHTLASQLVITFPTGFEVLTAPTGGSACLSNFTVSPDHLQVTADKSNCPAGTITLSGATVRNPAIPGDYLIRWVNDDSGSVSVPIMLSDQVGIGAIVEPSLAFDVGAQSASETCDGSFRGDGGVVPLGTLRTSSVASSDASGVAHVCTRLSANASGGTVVTVRSQNAALQSLSHPGDAIQSASGTLQAGAQGYGLCAGSSSTDSGAAPSEPASAPPVRDAHYAGNCSSSAHSVGALTTGDRALWTVAGPTQDAFARLYLKAAISGTTPAHSDYADTLTFTAVATY